MQSRFGYVFLTIDCLVKNGCPFCGADPGCNIDCVVCSYIRKVESTESSDAHERTRLCINSLANDFSQEKIITDRLAGVLELQSWREHHTDSFRKVCIDCSAEIHLEDERYHYEHCEIAYALNAWRRSRGLDPLPVTPKEKQMTEARKIKVHPPKVARKDNKFRVDLFLEGVCDRRDDQERWKKIFLCNLGLARFSIKKVVVDLQNWRNEFLTGAQIRFKSVKKNKVLDKVLLEKVVQAASDATDTIEDYYKELEDVEDALTRVVREYTNSREC